jgi:rubrerythrin
VGRRFTMNTKFLGEDEILKVAMNLEEEGIIIYSQFAKAAKNKKAKEIFKLLADYEKEHFDTFSRLHTQSIAGGPYPRPEEIDRELTAYLRGLIDTGVFTSLKTFPKAKLSKFSDKEAVSLGIQIEKNSILYYTEVYEANLVHTAKPTILEIIKEERKHLVMLYGVWEKLRT